jgi:hypothetical protein
MHAPTPCYNRMLQSHDIRNFPCTDHTHKNILYPNHMLLAHAKLPILQSQISFLCPNPTLLRSHVIIPFSNTMQQSHATSQGYNCMSEPNALVLVPKPKLTEPCISTFPWFCACIALFCFCALLCQKLCTDAIIGAFLGYSSLKRQHMLWLSAYSTVTAPSSMLNKLSSLNVTFLHVETPTVYSFLSLMVQRYVSAWPSFYTTVISNFV